MYLCYQADVLPKILCMGQNQTGKDWFLPPRISTEYIFLILCKGSLHLDENGCKRKLLPGDMTVLFPKTAYQSSQPGACEYFYIHLAPDSFEPFDCREEQAIQRIILENKQLLYRCDPFDTELYESSRLFFPKELHIGDAALLNQISRHMQEAISACSSRSQHYKLLCSCKFLEILSSLSLYFSAELFHDPQSKSLIRAAERSQKIIDFLSEAYPQKITGERISQEFGMNFDYLNRSFKKQTGMTIFGYLTQIRITKARELILNGNLRLYEIAEATGFCDEYHFSKTFKKETGLSPSRYLSSHC